MTFAVKLISSENNIRRVIIDIVAIFSLLTAFTDLEKL